MEKEQLIRFFKYRDKSEGMIRTLNFMQDYGMISDNSVSIDDLSNHDCVVIWQTYSEKDLHDMWKEYALQNANNC